MSASSDERREELPPDDIFWPKRRDRLELLGELFQDLVPKGFDAPVVAAAAAVGLLVACTLLVSWFMAWQRVPLDHSEGWNAYNAAAAMGGGRLYSASPSLWFVNYPPLSFFVVGSFAKLSGDVVAAGRAVSLLSALVAAFAIAKIARRFAFGRFESLLAALLFLASPWVAAKFVGIDDPQMLGQALGCIGFAVVIREPRSTRSLAIGAFFMTLALFVKPLFVDQPVALIVWLMLYERRNALIFAAFGICFGLIGTAVVDGFLHTDLLHDLLSARVYSFSRMFSHPGQWLITGSLPLAATLYLFRFWGDRHAILCAIYAVIALVFSLFFCGGEGVGGNPTIDLSIATALGTAVFVNRARNALAPLRLLGVDAARLVPLLALLVLGTALLASLLVGWDNGMSMRARMEARPTAARDIAYLAARPGPVLCDTETLCYWAGKQKEVDVFGYSQALKKHAGTERTLSRLLDAKYFGAVQLEKHSSLLLFPQVRASLARNYRSQYSDTFGTFLAPRK